MQAVKTCQKFMLLICDAMILRETDTIQSQQSGDKETPISDDNKHPGCRRVRKTYIILRVQLNIGLVKFPEATLSGFMVL